MWWLESADGRTETSGLSQKLLTFAGQSNLTLYRRLITGRTVTSRLASTVLRPILSRTAPVVFQRTNLQQAIAVF